MVHNLRCHRVVTVKAEYMVVLHVEVVTVIVLYEVSWFPVV